MTENSSEETKPNYPAWEAQAGYHDLCKVLRESLREVKDPELGMDVIQLGLIRNVIIESDQAIIEMILTTPFCPYAPMMVESVRRIAENALKMETSVSLNMEPWDHSMMENPEDDSWGFF